MLGHQDRQFSPAFRQQCRRLTGSYFAYFSVLALLVPYLGLYLDGLGFDSRQIGELIALSTCFRILGPPVWAALSDRLGRLLPAIQLGVLLSIGMLLVVSQLSTYWSVAVGLALISFFWSAILPQLEVLTLSSLENHHHLYGRIRLGGSLGFIAVALFAAEILAWGGVRLYPWLAILLLLPLAWLSFRIKEPLRVPRPVLETPIEAFWYRVRRRPFVFFIVSSVCLQISFAPFYAFFALYLIDLGYLPWMVGGLIALGVVAEVGMFLVAGRLLVRFDVALIIAVCLGITAVRWLMLGHLAGIFIGLIAVQLLHAFSFALHHAAAIRFIHQYFPVEQHSRGQALYLSIGMGLGGAIGALCAGWLWQQGSGAPQTFALAAVVTSLGMAFALLMRRSIQSQPLFTQ